MTLSRKILTAVALSAPLLGFAAPAAFDLDGSFNLTSNPNIYDSTSAMHTTVQGSLGDINDVVWYSFTGQAGQRFFADHDDLANADTLTDSVLSLFNANGQLLAQGDDGAADPGSYNDGSNWSVNPFLGVYTLPTTGVYYLAVSSTGNWADSTGCAPNGANPVLQQPGGGGYGGEMYQGCSANFSFVNNGSTSGSFTLNVSLGNGTAVPEPGSLSLAGLALAGLLASRRRR